MKICYFDAIGGISGDMMVAALLDCEDNEEYLVTSLKSLGIDDFQWQSGQMKKGAFVGKKIDFIVKKQDHCRHLNDISAIIYQSTLPLAIKEKIMEVFSLLADAESKVHGIDRSKVHFHEVGADDTILDIAAVVLLLDKMGIEQIVASPLPIGTGMKASAHGNMPLPAPALNHLLVDADIYGIEEAAETITPTGIGLLNAYGATYGVMPGMTLLATGTGCGTKEFQRPNMLRAFIGESRNSSGILYKMETTVDDMTGEDLGHLWDLVFQAGALDMHYTPIFMKKNRPATKITLLTDGNHKEALEQCLFKNTSTIGMNSVLVDRAVLQRKKKKVTTRYGEVTFKIAQGFGIKKEKPEYEEVQAIARKENLSLQGVRNALLRDYQDAEGKKDLF